ncbi:hypothetical protein [Flavobacterium subsaxonicum]|uniref:Uncharacterized protein n=1 Tax=Flavobacterium subsaxonicum WB 4.1-42 = DSM 21790 TaxID=1121898 RepID=A0A0A2MKC0_9FLAO|nr:hypothetical protein [Flavobacterium subsaxonicum]KGO92714.1 hypothetical protein Q766_11390 [Flavobacterium subsaxonicum WB 4.1-42 = DSM 21790]
MILGSFYLRRTSNGNLTGEFYNTTNDTIFTESADLQIGNNESFVGEYDSTYFDGGAQTRKLKIVMKNLNLNIFTLEWLNNGVAQFFGEGFINDDILIGTYWDDQLEAQLPDELVRFSR